MYVVAAEYKVKAGKEKEVIDILKKMIPLSRAEPGCKLYMVNQSPEDPGKLLLYEQYVNEDGYKAHQATDAFKENILGKVVTMLETRVRNCARLRRIRGVAAEAERGRTGVRRVLRGRRRDFRAARGIPVVL